jgi:hypothetical protein
VSGSNWRWFWAWAVPGIGFGLGVSTLGLLTAPAALLVATVLAHRRGIRAEAFGLLEGVAVVFAFVAWRAAFRDSGFSTTHWLAAGVAAGLGGFTGHLVGRRA